MMQGIIIKNFGVVLVFVLLDSLFLFLEKQFIESTAELLCILLFTLLLAVLVILNRKNHQGHGSRLKRISLRFTEISAAFIICWAAAFLISRL